MKKKIDLTNIAIGLVLAISALLCVLPFVHLLAISLSDNTIAAAGKVGLYPLGVNLNAYKYTLNQPSFWGALTVSVWRTIIGSVLGVFLTIITAYPLSKETSELPGRAFISWFFFITMLFSGGMIPSYMVVKQLGLMDTIWALILPNAMNVFNLILMLNFFRQIPKEIESAALVDGAGYFRILWQFYVPISMPSIATVLLFTAVGHWNSWFDGLIYMNSPSKFPLQSYLQTIVISQDTSQMNIEQIEQLSRLSKTTVDAAQIFIAAFPILCVYPFLQRYFVQGLVVGSVKG